MSENQPRGRNLFSNVRTAITTFWSSICEVTKLLIYCIGGFQIFSILIPHVYYSLATIPYFIVSKYYEFYRLFTGLFVDSFSFSFFLSIPLFAYTASKVEDKDGPSLLVYRVMVISLLSNILYTLLCWPILAHDPTLGYSLQLSGFGTIWPVFIFMELIRDVTLRQRLLSNRFFLVTAILLLLSSLLSLSSLVTALLVGLFHFFPAVYSPSKRVLQVFIPYPLLQWLCAKEAEQKVRASAVEQPPARIATMRNITGEQPPARIATIGNMTAEGTGREEAPQEHSRFKGTG
ncbi:hypothetical protein WA577_004093, partial [Blastocystis sp. JDR]